MTSFFRFVNIPAMYFIDYVNSHARCIHFSQVIKSHNKIINADTTLLLRLFHK